MDIYENAYYSIYPKRPAATSLKKGHSSTCAIEQTHHQKKVGGL